MALLVPALEPPPLDAKPPPTPRFADGFAWVLPPAMESRTACARAVSGENAASGTKLTDPPLTVLPPRWIEVEPSALRTRLNAPLLSVPEPAMSSGAGGWPFGKRVPALGCPPSPNAEPTCLASEIAALALAGVVTAGKFAATGAGWSSPLVYCATCAGVAPPFLSAAVVAAARSPGW